MGHISKECKSGQKIKNCSIQEETDNKKDNKQEGFKEGFKQTWYKGPLYLMLKINILFQIKEIIERKN